MRFVLTSLADPQPEDEAGNRMKMLKAWSICLVVAAVMVVLIVLLAILVKFKNPVPVKVKFESVGDETQLPPIDSMPLNLNKLIRISDHPSTFNTTDYEYFNYVLPTEFIANGTSQVRSYEGCYHENVFGIKFTFVNGESPDPVETALFGVQKYSLDRFAYVKKVSLDQPVTSVTSNFVDSSYPDSANITQDYGWKLINFQLNSNSDNLIGP